MNLLIIKSARSANPEKPECFKDKKISSAANNHHSLHARNPEKYYYYLSIFSEYIY